MAQPSRFQAHCRDRPRLREEGAPSCTVEGKIQTRSWDDKETGVKKYVHRDHRQRFVITAFGPRGTAGGSSRLRNALSNMDQRQPAASDEYSQAAEISDDDIPF